MKVLVWWSFRSIFRDFAKVVSINNFQKLENHNLSDGIGGFVEFLHSRSCCDSVNNIMNSTLFPWLPVCIRWWAFKCELFVYTLVQPAKIKYRCILLQIYSFYKCSRLMLYVFLPIKSQWCTLLFSSSGLFRLLYLTECGGASLECGKDGCACGADGGTGAWLGSCSDWAIDCYNNNIV